MGIRLLRSLNQISALVCDKRCRTGALCYMRLPSDGDRQSTALQRDALLAAAMDDHHLYGDKASGARADRLAWPVPSRLPGLAIAQSFGGWIGSAGRRRTC